MLPLGDEFFSLSLSRARGSLRGVGEGREGIDITSKRGGDHIHIPPIQGGEEGREKKSVKGATVPRDIIVRI